MAIGRGWKDVELLKLLFLPSVKSLSPCIEAGLRVGGEQRRRKTGRRLSGQAFPVETSINSKTPQPVESCVAKNYLNFAPPISLCVWPLLHNVFTKW